MKKLMALLSDFGLDNHFVGSMKGVILSVNEDIRIYDITHQIQPHNILEAAYSLADCLPYWPVSTVIAAVVDPGVGTERKSLVTHTKTGHFILCPDNGLLTIVENEHGLDALYQIDEKHRLPGSELHSTFHGRDIYAYNGAKLAAGMVKPADLGSLLSVPMVRLNLSPPAACEKMITGTITMVEKPFGNIRTNIPEAFLRQLHFANGDRFEFSFFCSGRIVYNGSLPLVKTFGGVEINEPLAYIDSSGRLGFAINQGNFSAHFQVDAGPEWKVELAHAT